MRDDADGLNRIRDAQQVKKIGLVEKFSLKSRLKSTFVSEISYRIEDFSKDRKSNKIRWEEVYFDFTELSKRKITLMRKIF